MERYRQQVRALGGEEAQARVRAARVALVGVGATGSAIAQVLVRAGVGRLRLIDRDLPELSNLQRQVLYDEADVAAGLPKAVAAAERLRGINGDVELEVEVGDLVPANARALLGGVDLVLDGTDNFLTRLLINDACPSRGSPVYVGVVGLRCTASRSCPGSRPASAVTWTRPAGRRRLATPPGSWAWRCWSRRARRERGAQAPRGREPRARGLFVLDTCGTARAHRAELPGDPDCPACAGRYDYLSGQGQAETALCGRDAILLRASAPVGDLEVLARRLEPTVRFTARNRFLLRFEVPEPDRALTVFADGRAIVHGTQDPAQARSLYARYVGG
ncbi:MAG: ThiF family adenylyltransferase [Planctomycetota bacterium]